MSDKSSIGTGAIVPIAVQPEGAARTLSAASEEEGDWLCAWCHTRVANEHDRFRVDGKDEFSLTNPEGIRFDIITFSETAGCRRTGIPTLEHTWFSGHAWCYCQCGECGQHLGWYFSGASDFAGLIKARILRALFVRN